MKIFGLKIIKIIEKEIKGAHQMKKDSTNFSNTSWYLYNFRRGII